MGPGPAAGQLRAMGVLAGAVFALVALLRWGPSGDDGRAQLVEPFALDDARRIELVRRVDDRAERVVMERSDGIWRVTEPFRADADPDVVAEVLTGVVKAQRAEPVEASSLADFGLAPPRAEVEVRLADGSTRSLVLGARAPVGLRSYALAGERPALIDGVPLDAVTRRVNEYRDHAVFRFRPEQVDRVAVESALGLLEATRSDAGWFLTGYGRADLDKLDDWLLDLQRLRVDMFLDLEHESIEDARYRVEVRTEDGRLQRLQIGQDTPYGTLALFRDGLDGVIAPPTLAMLERGPLDVADRRVFPFDVDHTTRVVLSGAREVTLEPSPTWAAVPEAAALAHAELTYRRDAPPLDTVVLEVELHRAGRVDRVQIGPIDAEGFRPVLDVGGGSPVRAEAAALAPLFAGG